MNFYYQTGEFLGTSSNAVNWIGIIGSLTGAVVGSFLTNYFLRRREKDKLKDEINKLTLLFSDSLRFLIKNTNVQKDVLVKNLESLSLPDFNVLLKESDFKIKIDVLKVLNEKEFHIVFNNKKIEYDQYANFISNYYMLQDLINDYPIKVNSFNTLQQQYKEEATQAINTLKSYYNAQNEILVITGYKFQHKKVFDDAINEYEKYVKENNMDINQDLSYYKQIVVNKLIDYCSKAEPETATTLTELSMNVSATFDHYQSGINRYIKEFQEFSSKLDGITGELRKILLLFE